MVQRISATELARRLGDVLGRVRYRGEVFLVERNGRPIARIEPVTGPASTVGDALRAWTRAGESDPGFADLLERIGAADLPPALPWDS